MTEHSVSGVPHRRLSSFYFFYFALLGCVAPFWGLFLQQRQFSAGQIGTLMASLAVVRVIAPNLWAWWAGYFSSPIIMVRVAGLLTALCFSLVWLVDSFSGMLLVMLAYGFFWAAMLPQYEAITMQALKNRIDEYSRIRLWGSVGFIVIVLLLGLLFDVVSVGWLPLVMLLTMLLIVLNSLLFRAADYRRGSHVSSQRSFLKEACQRPVVVFILISILLQISHGAYYTFFSIYLQDNGYNKTETGLLWSLGVFAEVILFWQFYRVMAKLSWRNWIVLSLLLTAIRWWLIATYVGQWLWLVVAQLFHAFSFGVMHAVAMRYVQNYFSPDSQARGQALYSSIGFGLGSALGAAASGQLWQATSGSLVFLCSAIVAMVALLLTLTGLREHE